MALLDAPAANRPAWKRMTLLWGAATSALLVIEQANEIPAGTVATLQQAATDAVAGYGKFATGYLTLIGLYRQVAA